MLRNFVKIKKYLDIECLKCGWVEKHLTLGGNQLEFLEINKT